MYNFAIIGCGSVSKKHAEEINKIGKLVAVCDIVASKADEFAAQLNSKPYYSIDDLLANEQGVDIISICTPIGCHAEHFICVLNCF